MATGGYAIRKIRRDGVVVTIAGQGGQFCGGRFLREMSRRAARMVYALSRTEATIFGVG